jgi:hypothetical protein
MDILSWDHQDITTDTLIKDVTQAIIQPLELKGDYCMLCNKDIKDTPLTQHIVLEHKLIKLYMDSMQDDRCPNKECDLKSQKFMKHMNYSLAIHTLIHCNDPSARSKFFEELKVIKIHSKHMAKLNLINENKIEEADKWLACHNKETPWDMPGLTASSHSENSDSDTDTKRFDPPPSSTTVSAWRIW